VQSFTSVCAFYLVVQALGLVVLPLTREIFAEFVDGGWAFSKCLGIILVSWLIWFLGRAHLVEFSSINSWLIVAVVMLMFWGGTYFTAKQKAISFKQSFLNLLWNAQSKRYVIVGEVLFAGFLFGGAFLRSFKPELTDTEKFMDYGFLLSSLKSTYFPPLDHFLAGETINYYYFGHFMAAVITKLSAVFPPIAYNIQMSNIFALGAIQSFSLSASLFHLANTKLNVKSWRPIIAGVSGVCFTLVLGNLHLLFFYPQNPSKYWFPTATRYIDKTIHEFPSYSYIINDLHAHVSAIPFSLLTIALSLVFFVRLKNNQRLIANVYCLFISAFVIGSFYILNSWSFAVYLLLFAALGLLIIIRSTGSKKVAFAQIAATLLALLGLSILIWFPQWIDLHPPANGIGWVSSQIRTPLWQFIIVWGLQLYFVISFFVMAWRQRLGGIFIEYSLALIATALLLVIIPEFIYVKDILLGFPRSNTVFKLYFEAWIILSVLMGPIVLLVWDFQQGLSIIVRRLWRGVAVFLIFSAACYPVVALWQFFPKTIKGLDGSGFLKYEQPNDFAAITWINDNLKKQSIILEAVGDSFTRFARVSTFTGFPTVIGWPTHEQLWRGSYDSTMKPISQLQLESGQVDTIAKRVADVRQIYEGNDDQESAKLLEKYKVRYIFVGSLERQKYPRLSEGKFGRIAKNIYDQSSVRIYEFPLIP
jgi:uncharacterized membrane protein